MANLEGFSDRVTCLPWCSSSYNQTETQPRMWPWLGGRNGTETARKAFVRNFSRKCAPNLRKINPRVPQQEAASISEALYHIIKHHGPLTVSNTWNHAKEAGINGLTSKTHMKIMLKWMRGRSMLSQWCNHIGSSKKFLLSTLPEESKLNRP